MHSKLLLAFVTISTFGLEMYGQPQNEGLRPSTGTRIVTKEPLPKSGPRSADGMGESLVRSLIRDGGAGPDLGPAALRRMGDRAAVYAMKVIGTEPVSEQSALNVLGVLRKAFARPEAIYEESERAPKTTQILLSFLETKTESASVKQEIAAVRDFVLSGKGVPRAPDGRGQFVAVPPMADGTVVVGRPAR
jgi:hypothetical protein